MSTEVKSPAVAKITQSEFLAIVMSNLRSKPEMDVDWNIVASKTNYGSGQIARIRFNTIIRGIAGLAPDSPRKSFPKSSKSSPKPMKSSPSKTKTARPLEAQSKITAQQDNFMSPSKVTKSCRGKKNTIKAKPVEAMFSDVSNYEVLGLEDAAEPVEKKAIVAVVATHSQNDRIFVKKPVGLGFMNVVPVKMDEEEDHEEEDPADFEEPMEDMFSDNVDFLDSSSDDTSI